jgi:hypothetical protein
MNGTSADSVGGLNGTDVAMSYASATLLGPASAMSTLFVVTTPDGLRAQSTFASSTVTR